MLFVIIIPKIPPNLLLKVFNFVFYAYPQTLLGDQHVRDARRICPAKGNWLFKNRSLLPLLVLIVCYGYYVSNIYVEDPFYQTISNYCPSYKYGCLLISLVGVAIRVYTIGYAPAGTSGRNTAKQIADELNTTGIYSIIRHPLYFGNYLMSLGIVLLPRSITLTVIFTLIFWLYYERIMYAEEDFLRHKFGQDFLNWSARVPTFLPRRITGWATSLPFSWKKVLRQEKMEFGLFF